MSIGTSLLWESLGRTLAALETGLCPRGEECPGAHQVNSKRSFVRAGRQAVHYLAEKHATGSAIRACD